MGALLHELSVAQHQDPVRPSDGGETVGDHDGGAPLEQAGERALDLALGVAVDVGGRLVEHQDRRIRDQGPGEAQKLALPEREVRSALIEHRIVALGEAPDEVVGPDRARRRLHLRARGVRLVVADVVVDRSP